MGIQKKDSTRTTGLGVYITVFQCDTKSWGSHTGFIRMFYLVWLFAWESFTTVQFGRFGERRLRNLAVFMWPTDGSFPSRLRNSTRHGSCKMPSKYGLSRFHASPSVLLLVLTLLKQAKFCSSTRNIQKQPDRQSNNQSHKMTICKRPEQWTRKLRQQPHLRNLAVAQLRKITQTFCPWEK